MSNSNTTTITTTVGIDTSGATAWGTVAAGELARLEGVLRHGESSEATVEKYLRDAGQFAQWLDGRPLEREAVVGWRESLTARGLVASTVNAKLAAVNALLRAVGREECRAGYLKVQRCVFRDASRDLSREEYLGLVRTAYAQGNDRLALVMETICATGIRVSELADITVEAVRCGRATIRLKGKLRVVLLPAGLRRKLLGYARRNGVARGPVFVTATGRPMSRRQVWGEMKALCAAAGVDPAKVFPHNLRHLFAVEYYREDRDIVKLADLMGHSSIETTRVYLMQTGAEHLRHLENMGLVLPPARHAGRGGASRAS